MNIILGAFLFASSLTAKPASGQGLDSLYLKAIKLASTDLDSTEVLGEILLKKSLEAKDYESAGKGAFVIGSVNEVRKKVLNAGMRYYEALQYLRKAETDDTDLVISIYISLGYINGLAGRTSEGISTLKQALDLCGDCGKRSYILYNLGYWSYIDQAYDSSVVNLFQAYELSVNKENFKRAANCLNYIGLCNHYTENYNQAREYYFKILNSEDFLGDQYRESAAWAFHNIGFSYFAEGDLEKALEHYHKALEIKVELADTSLKFTTLLDIGEIKLQQGKLDESISYLEKAANIYNLTNHTPETFKVYDFLELAYAKKDPVKHRFYLDRMKQEYNAYIVRMEDLRTEQVAFEMERIQDQVLQSMRQHERVEAWKARAYWMVPFLISIGILLFVFFRQWQKKKHRELVKLVSEI